MKMFSSLKKWASRLLPAAVLGLFIAGGALTAGASGPVFNGIHTPNGDYPTLQVAKAGDTTWSTSRDANIGDTLYLYVWVHNSGDATANNVHAKVTLPTDTATTFSPSATLTADNAASLTGNVTINIGQESRLSFVPDSAQLQKSQMGSDGRFHMVDVSWPTGVNGNDVVGPNGVALGNIDPCWQYAQAIRLQVRVEGTQAGINTNKKVGIAGGAPFSDAVNAQPGDAAEYRIFFENTGTGTGHEPQIEDTLDAHHKYIPGTSFARVKQNNNDYDQPIPDSNIRIENLADGRQRLTYQFTDMAPRPDTAFYLLFQVRLANADAFPVGTTVIPNVATASFAGGISQTTNQTTITVVKAETPVVTFTLVKQVANVTIGDNTWKDELNGSAGPGDTVAFKLTMTNTGNTTADQVTLKDILPTGMTFVDGTGRLYNRNTGNDGTPISGNDIVNNGYVFAHVEAGTPNQQIFIFHAKLTNDCSGQQTLTNIGRVFWQGNKMAEDTARVIYACERGLIIQKDVQVPGSSNWVDNGGVVAESVVLKYRIIVTNNGNTVVNNPVLRDTLPSDVTYINNSLRIDGEVMSGAVQNGFFNQGALLTNFTPGMSKTITFEVRVADCPTLGDHQLVNTAFVKADGVAEKSDTATVTLRVNRPDLTF
jgi:uncharacterized repeat protein (TIGR01451 family)